MKFSKILLFASLCLLASCTQPGMNFYTPMTFTRADGSTGVKSVKVASFAAEFVGLRMFKFNAMTGECDIQFQEGVLSEEQYAVQDRDGKLVGILTRKTVAGIYTAKVIEAYGVAFREVTDGIAAGITGAILSAAGPVALGNGFNAIPIK